jgi:hypothetical protein
MRGDFIEWWKRPLIATLVRHRSAPGSRIGFNSPNANCRDNIIL